jgi:protein-S-isoprenylcysteine O-methyltransferase Ste14
MNDPREHIRPSPKLHASGYIRMVTVTVFLAGEAAVFFLAAGRLDIPRAWLYFALNVLQLAVNFVLFMKKSPEIINQRGKVGPGIRLFDKILMSLYTPMPFVIFLVAGLDVGRNGGPRLGISSLVLGLALLIGSAVLVAWAMVSNPYFETTVRIQDERGHRVAMDGPYRYVRHPGYVGFILTWLAPPLVIGSAYALIPAAVITVIIVLRTHFEDTILRRELEGYADYAQKTRYRLLPPVW